MRLGIYIACVLAATILQMSALPGLFGTVRPDLVTLFVVTASLFGGPVRGALTGLLGGLVTDLFTGYFVGMSVLTKGMVGFIVGWLEPQVFKERLIVPVAVAAAATAGEQLAYWLLLSAFGQGLPFHYALNKVMWPTLLFNTVLAYPVYYLVQMLEKFLAEVERKPR